VFGLDLALMLVNGHWNVKNGFKPRKNILQSKAPPLSGSEWRSSLRLSSKAPKLTQAMEAAAKSYITDLTLTRS
jgi:hypothetical protein